MASAEYSSYPAWKLELLSRRQKEKGEMQSLPSQKYLHVNTNGLNKHKDARSANSADQDENGNVFDSRLALGSLAYDSQDELVNHSELLHDTQQMEDNVVFEHIVPRAVKQMWLNATSFSGGRPNSDGPLNKASIIKSKPVGVQMSFRKVSSTPLGGVLVSKDIASSAGTGIDAAMVSQEKALSGSEELNDVANPWGVKLRHVRPKEEGERLVELKLKQRRNSNVFATDEHSAPHDESWLNMSPRLKGHVKDSDSLFSAQVSLTKLTKGDAVAPGPIDATEPDAESDFHAMPVRKRKDSFEHHSMPYFTPPVFDKFAQYNTRASRRPSLGGISDSELTSMSFTDDKANNAFRETEYGYSDVFPHVDSFVSSVSGVSDVPSQLHPRLRATSSSDIEKDIVPRFFQKPVKSRDDFVLNREKVLHMANVFTLKSFATEIVPGEIFQDSVKSNVNGFKPGDIPISVITSSSDFDDSHIMGSNSSVLTSLRHSRESAAPSFVAQTFTESSPSTGGYRNLKQDGKSLSQDKTAYNKLGQVVLPSIHSRQSSEESSFISAQQPDIIPLRVTVAPVKPQLGVADGTPHSISVKQSKEEESKHGKASEQDMTLSSAGLLKGDFEIIGSTANYAKVVGTEHVPVSLIDPVGDTNETADIGVSSSSSKISPQHKPRIIGKVNAAVAVAARGLGNLSLDGQGNAAQESKAIPEEKIVFNKLGQVVLSPTLRNLSANLEATQIGNIDRSNQGQTGFSGVAGDQTGDVEKNVTSVSSMSSKVDDKTKSAKREVQDVKRVEQQNVTLPVAQLPISDTDSVQNISISEVSKSIKKSASEVGASGKFTMANAVVVMETTPFASMLSHQSPSPLKVENMEMSAVVAGSLDGSIRAEQTSTSSQQKRRLGKLIILSGDARNEQLKNLSRNTSSGNNVRHVKVHVESANKESNQNGQVPHVEKSVRHPGKRKDMDGVALTFLSNALDDAEAVMNEPMPKAPDIIFNNPLVKLKSMMTSLAGNENRKKLRVSFNSSKIAVVHSYPSEESLMAEQDASDLLDALPQSSTNGLASYQPQTVSDLGTVLQRERQRIALGSKGKDVEQQHGTTLITLTQEGDHFNTHTQEGGHFAILF